MTKGNEVSVQRRESLVGWTMQRLWFGLLPSSLMCCVALAHLAAADVTGPRWVTDIALDTLPNEQGKGILTYPGVVAVPDGSDGAFVFWEDEYTGNIAGQRVSGSGALGWGALGISVAPIAGYQWAPVAISDGVGGTIVAWVDSRQGWCGPSLFSRCDVYAQRIDANGVAVWPTADVPISTARANQGIHGIAIVSPSLDRLARSETSTVPCAGTRRIFVRTLTAVSLTALWAS